MSVVKRFAFWPLLAVACVILASARSNPEHGSAISTLVGLGLSIPLAFVIDSRRQRRWHAGGPQRLLP